MFVCFFQGNRWHTPGWTSPTLPASWSPTGVGAPLMLYAASLTQDWDQPIRNMLASQSDMRYAIFSRVFLCDSFNPPNPGERQVLSRWREGHRWKRRLNRSHCGTTVQPFCRTRIDIEATAKPLYLEETLLALPSPSIQFSFREADHAHRNSRSYSTPL